MRKVTAHDPKGENQVVIESWDEPDPKGVHYKYRLSINQNNANQEVAVVKFQDDRQTGLNGVTDAAILAMLIDRMECFLKKATAYENSNVRELSLTRTKLEEALFWLLKAEGK